MKKTDIAMIILIASISVVVAFFVASSIPFLQMPQRGTKVETVEKLSNTIDEPDSAVFNKEAINPAVETIIGQSTIDQGRDKGCSPRERLHRDTFGNTGSREQKSWIGNGRGTCITDKGELLAVLELSKDSLKGLVFVELMVCKHGSADMKVLEELATGTSIFC